MAAQALYLRYRPQTFEEVVGQEPITRTLQNALRQGRIRHAYLFTGPRGTGKTTMARLLAKAVNCHAQEEDRPCNECPICSAINQARLLDLIEIDAASNRGIDEIRDIREKVGFRPNEGRFKVYVLDEAHMLTEPAFNALLKTLEEPPPHVLFVLVTTDPHKIPATITSRCQRFDFRRISVQAIVDRLAYIAGKEGVTVEPAALELIAHHGTGAMRDAISLLDQLTSYGDEITLDQVQMVLGTISSEAAGELIVSLADGDVTSGLDVIHRTIGDGADPRQFGREIVEYLRGLLLVQQGAGTRLLNATAEQAAAMEALAKRMSTGQVLLALRRFNGAVTDIKSELQVIPQLPLEVAFVETIVEPAGPVAARQPKGDQAAALPATPLDLPSLRESETRRMAERQTPTASTPPAAEMPASVPTETDAQPPPVAAALSLELVAQAWGKVLQAVRVRNPTAEGALRSGCEPVEVDGNQVVVTFPYPFLREKLGDPQRTMELQDALSEVLHTTCRVKLVLASEYTPQQQTVPAQNARVPEQTASSDDQVPDEISRWAEQHGAQARLVP